MFNFSRIKVYLAAACLLLAPALFAAADDVSVQVSVEPQSVAAGQSLQLTVVISGAMRNVGQPQIEGLEGFTLGGTSQSSNFSFINGRVNTSVSYVYSLFAAQAGTFSIGPAKVEVKGTTYSSNVVKVTVGQGGAQAQPAAPAQPPGAALSQAAPAPQSQNAPPQAAPEAEAAAPDGSVFIQGTADRREVYVGEQVIYTFGFFYRTRLVQNPEYTPPAFNGFWVEQVDDNAVQSQRSVNGVAYVVQELRYALFPTSAGEATVTPASLGYVVSNPWDFWSGAQRFQLKTKPVTIKVKPLPESGRPGDFNGAVGKFTLAAHLDKSEVKQGEPVTLEITVHGSGNIKTLQEPKLPGMKDFDIYSSKSEESLERGASGISGKKVFRYVLVPRKSGNYGWDSIDYSYFDPSAEKYVLMHSEPVKFTVTPAAAGSESPGYRLAPEKVLSLGEDIHYIKEDRSILGGPEATPFESKLFWAGHLLPLLCIGLALSWRRHRGRLASDTGYARLRGSGRKVNARLKEASKAITAGNAAAAYSALDRALVDYIGDKLNFETRGMVTDQIVEALSGGRGLDGQLVKEVRACLDHFAFARFAPATVSGEDAREYLEKVRNLVSRLERAL